MKDKELLQKAIDNYDLYTPSEKKVLKTLMEISIDNKAIISLKKLAMLAKVSKPIIYKALATLQKEDVVERTLQGTTRKSSFIIKQNKLLEIAKHYELFLKKIS